MSSSSERLLRVWLFLFLCLIVAWSIWVPQALKSLRYPKTAMSGTGPADVLAVWAPALLAILMARVTEGRAGLTALISQLRRWRVGFHWYLFVLLYPGAVWWLSRGIDAVLGHPFHFTGPAYRYFSAEPGYLATAAIVFAFPNALGEELGWRGYALPRLQSRHGAFLSSIILGAFWALWHIPLWIANQTRGLYLLRASITIVAYALLYTWVYNNTGRSVLLVWLFHVSMTITQYILETPLTLTDDVLRWAFPCFVLLAFRGRGQPRPQSKDAPLRQR
jgi:membrane protease YdiL (CAAX protease family)